MKEFELIPHELLE